MPTASLFFPAPEMALEVRVARIRRRWRQSDLAIAAGVRCHDVSRIECGKHVFIQQAERVLSTLGIPLEDFDAVS